MSDDCNHMICLVDYGTEGQREFRKEDSDNQMTTAMPELDRVVNLTLDLVMALDALADMHVLIEEHYCHTPGTHAWRQKHQDIIQRALRQRAYVERKEAAGEIGNDQHP